jgi:hypothetical protein
MDISELTIYKSNQSASMKKRKPNPKEKAGPPDPFSMSHQSLHLLSSTNVPDIPNPTNSNIKKTMMTCPLDLVHNSLSPEVLDEFI